VRSEVHRAIDNVSVEECRASTDAVVERTAHDAALGDFVDVVEATDNARQRTEARRDLRRARALSVVDRGGHRDAGERGERRGDDDEGVAVELELAYGRVERRLDEMAKATTEGEEAEEDR